MNLFKYLWGCWSR